MRIFEQVLVRARKEMALRSTCAVSGSVLRDAEINGESWTQLRVGSSKGWHNFVEVQRENVTGQRLNVDLNRARPEVLQPVDLA